jgi:hypothetical protein
MMLWTVITGSCGRARDYALGFLEVKSNQSMTRLGALVCFAIGGCVARAAISVAMRPHLTAAHAEVIKGLAGVAALFIGGGGVALLKRTKPEDLLEVKAND